MDSFTKYTRIQWVKKLNFGGTTDWAVDLQEFQGSVDDGDGEDNADIDNEHDEDCIQEYANLDALVADINNVASVCAAEYAIGTMATLLDETLKKYDEIKNDYDGKFGYYAGYIDELVNPQLEVRICLVSLTITPCPVYLRLYSLLFHARPLTDCSFFRIG
jgi:chitinase